MSDGRGADNSVRDLVLELWEGREAEEKELSEEPAEESADQAEEPSEAPVVVVEQAGPAVRLAWSAAYGIKAALIAVAVFLASAIVLTMVFNPELTLLEAVNLYIEKISEFVGGIGA